LDTQTLGILALVRAALKDERVLLPDGFDLGQASQTLYEHHLTALAVRGALRCGISGGNPALRQLTALFCGDVAKSRRQMQLLERLYALFREQGIEYMPVKGAVIKPLYPQSELRIMGDADILIRQDQYPKIRELLPSLGLERNIETDHEYIWRSGDLTLELHKRLMPSYNKDYFAYYGDGWRFARRDGQSSAFHMGPEDHFIYLLVHFAKHYREGAICAKNICDFWVWRKAHPAMDEAYLNNQLGQLKLRGFYRNILDLLDTWFEGAEPTEAVETLTRTAFQGSIFSRAESLQTVSAIKLGKQRVSLSGSKIRLLLRKVFPSVNALAGRYPVLLKAPILLPLIWLVRAFEILFLHPDRRKKGMDDSRKLMDMDSEKVALYEEELRRVGLAFNFPE